VSRGRIAVLLVALAAAALAPGAARADGDPASDYLITMPIYFPYDAKFSPQLEAQLIGVVADAKKKGFPIKVALIPDAYDLGSVGVLWKRPKQYAKFLGEEDAPFFRQRLLVVMPNGFGFYRPGADPAPENATLAKIAIAPGQDGLVRAAIDGVTALAAADGVTVTAGHVATQAQRNSHDRVVIVVAVVLALALGAVARVLLRRRTRERPQ